MPTVFQDGSYRFFFYSNEGCEPPYVHVERDGKVAKLWLSPIRLQGAGGLSGAEIRKILRVAEGRQEQLVEAWNDYFGSEN